MIYWGVEGFLYSPENVWGRKGPTDMSKIRKETLQAILDEFQGYPGLEESIDELIDPQMGLISGLQEMIDAVNGLKSADLENYSPF